MLRKRWEVQYRSMVYDMGFAADWDQQYFTKLGAYFSRFTHNRIRSWGGEVSKPKKIA